jgi:hypothetical protein
MQEWLEVVSHHVAVPNNPRSRYTLHNLQFHDPGKNDFRVLTSVILSAAKDFRG